jgi:hypothetical protein
MFMKYNDLPGDEELKEKGGTGDCGYPSENEMVPFSRVVARPPEEDGWRTIYWRQHETLL